jgi:hypothetical protein
MHLTALTRAARAPPREALMALIRNLATVSCIYDLVRLFSNW